MWEPEGPLPRHIYQRRRVAAIGLGLLVLLIVIIVVAVSCSGGSDDPDPAAAAAAATTTQAEAPQTTTTGPATTAPSATPSVGEGPQPAGADPAEKKDDTVAGGQCSDAAIGLTVEPESPNYSVGDQVTFLTTVTNIGSVPCVRDVSGPLVVNTVATVDGTQVWSNADCFPGTGSDIRTLKPGEQAQFKMLWAGTSSAQGCSPDERTAVPAGVYTVTSHLGDLASEPVPFNIH